MFHKRLLAAFPDNRKLVAGMVFGQWLMLLANILLVLTVADFLETVITGDHPSEKILWMFLVLLIVLLVRGGLNAYCIHLSFLTSNIVKSRLRTWIYEKLMRLGGGYRDHVPTAEAVQLAAEGVEQLEIYFGKYVPQFFYSLLAPLTLFVIVGSMSLKVAAVLLVCVPLIPLSIIAVQKFAKKMLARYWTSYTEMGDSFLECLQGLTTLKIYQADARYARRMAEEAEKFRKITMRVLIMQLNSISVMDLVAYGGAAVGMVLSVRELQQGAVTVSQCFFMILIAAEFFLPLRLLGSFFHIAMNGNAAADKIFRLLDLPEEKGEDPESGKEAEEGSVWEERETDVSQEEAEGITLWNVSFAYEKTPVLSGISLRAGKGLTALAGESGCGKSTVFRLLTGEKTPDAGTVLLHGRPLSAFSQKERYQRMTRICHDSYLFAGSVRDNLKMGNPDAGEAEMKEALVQVKLWDDIRENGGLDLKLSERAANLSGGQRQRLALARALLHDSEIYLLDEATSNVDAESETAIMEAVYRLAETKIVLLISHRLANVTRAKQILMLENGRITEQGTQEELLRQKGAYNRMFEKQQALEACGRTQEFRKEAVHG